MRDSRIIDGSNRATLLKKLTKTLSIKGLVMDEKQINELMMDIKNWMPCQDLPKHYPQFSHSTLKTMFWTRAERPGLSRCARMVGKKLFVNVLMFGLWLGGQLPEQKNND